MKRAVDYTNQFMPLFSRPYVDNHRNEEMSSPHSHSDVVGQGQAVDSSNWQCTFCLFFLRHT